MKQTQGIRRSRGYTLIELMVTVAILGILAALAVPAYTTYIYETRASEGPTLLQGISTRQEAYYAEFGSYVDVYGSGYPGTAASWASAASSFTPDATAIHGVSTAWPAAHPAGWDLLGFQPNGPIRMGVTTVAGPPGSQPGAMTPDFWYVAAALADLDDDGNYMVFEKSSQNDQVGVESADRYD